MHELITELQNKLREFLKWETEFSYQGWESIEVFIADTLSNAWIKARPGDIYKFDDSDFKNMVDSANGKWLEKQYPEDTYKILLSYNDQDMNGLLKVYIHELRQCLDYQCSVQNLSFKDYHPGNTFFTDWSEFRAAYADTRLCFYLKTDAYKRFNHNTIFTVLSEILGTRTADILHGLMNSHGNPHDVRYFISRYLGVQRAIRNLKTKYDIKTPVFELWTMTPHYIIENFGYVFYISNEWDDMDVCPLDAIPQTYYYNEFLEKAYRF